jgi:putative ABC transport system substrate-binding protein
MGLGDDVETQARTKAIEQGLAERGWVVGRNLRMEYRFAGADAGRVLKFAKELVALRPDLIVGHSTPVVEALHQETQVIPIVFVVVSDPIGSGFVTSFARPSGNITGFSVMQSSITGKYLSIMRELKPALTRAAVMYNSETSPSGGELFTLAFRQAAAEFHVVPITADVHNEAEIEEAVADLAAEPNCGLVVMPGNFISANRETVISSAARWRVPTIYPYRYFVDDGGLLSYGFDVLDLFRRLPDYVDRILRGADPAELPVQAPRKFELAINLKTARACNFLIPRLLLAGADTIIE